LHPTRSGQALADGPAALTRSGQRYGSRVIDRPKQIERDRYYMGIAEAVEAAADCLGTHVGAVIVLEKRVVSTGYNGTPAGFPNCSDRGCVRCYDRWLEKQGRSAEMSDPSHTAGRALDRCVCVHAEQNAFITAARFGIAVEGATVYTTWSPCFSCLKEAVQAKDR
jgi:dCMP deaminase